MKLHAHSVQYASKLVNTRRALEKTCAANHHEYASKLVSTRRALEKTFVKRCSAANHHHDHWQEQGTASHPPIPTDFF